MSKEKAPSQGRGLIFNVGAKKAELLCGRYQCGQQCQHVVRHIGLTDFGRRHGAGHGVDAVNLDNALVGGSLGRDSQLLLRADGIFKQDTGGMGQRLIDGTHCHGGGIAQHLDVGLGDGVVIIPLTGVGMAMWLVS